MTAIVTLPVDFALRRPTMEDASAAADVIAASDIALHGSPDYSAQDVRDDWSRHGFDLQTDAWLVAAPDGQVVGYAAVFDDEGAHIYAEVFVHPAYQERGIGTLLLHETERRAHVSVPRAPSGARVTLGQGINARNAAARQLLEGEGYVHERTFWDMRIDFDGPPRTPEWPQGIAARVFVPGQDDYVVWEAGDEAFQDHWQHVTIPFEQWRHDRVAREGFDPSLWFLACDGDTIAGMVLCRYRMEGGWVSSLSVRRPWRGRGLGMALLLHAFGEFYRRGKSAVGLGVDSENLTGATRLYERAGMHVERQYDYYAKELRAATI